MFEINNTALILIDVQGKLALQMSDKEKLFQNLHAVVSAIEILGVPILWTEQAPDKIGQTIPEIASLLNGQKPIKKLTFSCIKNEEFLKALELLKRRQILICGIETHVCIYQTVCDLVESDYEVEVIEDAVSSRTRENKNIALEKIKQTGAKLTSLEMIITELLQGADHPKFKEVLKLIK